MIKRPAPKAIPQEEMKNIMKASSEQTSGSSIVKSWDENFPVFTPPAGNKVLVYIPNHTVVTPDGATILRADRCGIHACRDGKQFTSIRCTYGIESETLHLDGHTCPLCDSVQKCWELYNRQYADMCRARAIDPETEDGYKQAQPIRDQLREKFAVGKAEIWLTFPIVVIDCEERDGMCTGVPKLDKGGKLTGKPYFYSVRESTYTDKWVKGLDSLSVDTIITHPAGTWAVLNYIVTDSNNKVVQNPKPRDAAKALSVNYKAFGKKYAQWANYFDEMTKDWTPEKAAEVVVANNLRDLDEMNEANDQLMKKTNDTLALLDASGAPRMLAPSSAPAVGGSAEEVLANFGGEAVPNVGMGAAPVGAGAPVVDGQAPVVQ